jgi:hypothetical protein
MFFNAEDMSEEMDEFLFEGEEIESETAILPSKEKVARLKMISKIRPVSFVSGYIDTRGRNVRGYYRKHPL